MKSSQVRAERHNHTSNIDCSGTGIPPSSNAGANGSRLHARRPPERRRRASRERARCLESCASLVSRAIICQMSEERDGRIGAVFIICGFISMPLLLALGTPKSHPIVLSVLLGVCAICAVLAENKIAIVLGFVAFMLLRIVIATVFLLAR
jgi:hypothetical protein